MSNNNNTVKKEVTPLKLEKKLTLPIFLELFAFTSLLSVVFSCGFLLVIIYTGPFIRRLFA